LTEASPSFRGLFNAQPQVVASAPGRVNLIGEHTDYNEGFVLPAAIPKFTRVELSPHANQLVRAYSDAEPSAAPVEFELGSEAPRGQWIDYVQGVTVALRAAGFAPEGFDLCVHSDIPAGAGLSSSAALGVALLRALREAFSLDLDDLALARLALAGETDFVGAPVGPMDPMVCSLGRQGEALLIDTRSMAVEHVALPRDAEFIVIDSGVPHAHASGEYRIRRAECEQAARQLGVRVLRDVRAESDRRLESLPEPERQRARHVVGENARVLAAVEALRVGDSAALGALLNASHTSLRDDFEVSCAELDTLVELAQSQANTYGARMTGGGFGGSIVALVALGTTETVAQAVCEAYSQRTGRPCAWFALSAAV